MAKVGEGTIIWHPDKVNIYGCEIGRDCNIGAFVEIGPGVKIGDRVRIGAFTFIPEGVTIEDDVFVGPGVTFTNDRYPPSDRTKWEPTRVCKGASIGARAIILPGVVIGEGALVGAGSLVTKDVHSAGLAYGAPARPKGGTA
jgi:acetyltransferase-like isoleucine patch superfamily enzyme